MGEGGRLRRRAKSLRQKLGFFDLSRAGQEGSNIRGNGC